MVPASAAGAEAESEESAPRNIPELFTIPPEGCDWRRGRIKSAVVQFLRATMVLNASSPLYKSSGGVLSTGRALPRRAN